MESKNYNKLLNITKTNTLTDIENKLAVTNGERERGRGNTGLGNSEVQTVTYKISYKDMLCNTEYSQYFIIAINGV